MVTQSALGWSRPTPCRSGTRPCASGSRALRRDVAPVDDVGPRIHTLPDASPVAMIPPPGARAIPARSGTDRAGCRVVALEGRAGHGYPRLGTPPDDARGGTDDPPAATLHPPRARRGDRRPARSSRPHALPRPGAGRALGLRHRRRLPARAGRLLAGRLRLAGGGGGGPSPPPRPRGAARGPPPPPPPAGRG